MQTSGSPCAFDLDQPMAYQRWRNAKLSAYPKRIEDLMVDVGDPRCLSQSEQAAILLRCANANMAVYRSPVIEEDKGIARRLGQQLGLHQLDANWLSDEDGISQITVSRAEVLSDLDAGSPQGQRPDRGRAGTNGRDERGAFIPYTNRPIKWHTDGYYHPLQRRIQAMILHCVRSAAEGGINALVDHDMLYIALRDANPDWVRALMAPDAMTIPARMGDDGEARADQSGPVFSVLPEGRGLHMRYTARTRSIEWKDDGVTHMAVAFLERLLASNPSYLFHIRLEAGMGIVGNNIPHDRTAFIDDPQSPRLLYRARYLDRIESAPLVSDGLIKPASEVIA